MRRGRYFVALSQLLVVYSRRHLSGDMEQTPKHLRNALGMLQNVKCTLSQVPSAGRGLLASEAISQGTKIHAETPMICYPSLSHICHHCLRPVESQQSFQAKGTIFCSKECHAQASLQYFDVEKLLRLKPLHQHCQAYNEQFPLLAMRAACQHLQQSVTLSEATSQSSDNKACQPHAAPQGDLWQDYKFLTFARIPPPPPPPWVDAHGLLHQALQHHIRAQSQVLPLKQQRALEAALADLSLEWYIDLLSRLHINSFRVDGIPAPSLSAEGLSLADMAAAAVTGSEEGRLGTAVYLLASLFNHSCIPNVDVTFPHNNSTAVFVAARDIEQAEELCISYIDATASVAARQQQLQWGYGFTCKCHLCLEELQPTP